MKKKISIIGGGASALMLACELDTKKFQVDIYERNQAPARKFLVAGDGGLNITHSENSESFIQRYTPSHFLSQAFAGFTNSDFIKWLHQMGIQTYTGSSGRVFPVKELKPVDVLSVILTYIKNNHVGVHTKHEWLGFAEHKEVVFKTDAGNKIVQSDYYVFCLGGASWPVTGSRGDWTNYFLQEGIKINPFAASNCSFKINWPEKILNGIEGRALKNCVFTCNGKSNLGEAVLTKFGIEGSGVYPLSAQIREELNKFGEAKLFLDLKPVLSKAAILAKINQPKGKNNFTQHLVEQLNLNHTQLTLIKNYISKEDFLDAEKLSVKIKNLPLIINGTDSIDNAISSVGGIDLNEIDANFKLKKLPNCFAIGEMLDYDAPTGGYLLQSCFSMGHFLAQYLNSTL